MKAYSILILGLLQFGTNAFADTEKNGRFQPLAGSGLVGDARLRSEDAGRIEVKLELEGLVPGPRYSALAFRGASCQANSLLALPLFSFQSRHRGFVEIERESVRGFLWRDVWSVGIAKVGTGSLLGCANLRLQVNDS